MIISSIQATLFTILFISWFKPSLRKWEPYLLITIIVVNTISVIVSTNLIVSLVDGFGACVVGYILYKDHIRNLK